MGIPEFDVENVSLIFRGRKKEAFILLFFSLSLRSTRRVIVIREVKLLARSFPPESFDYT